MTKRCAEHDRLLESAQRCEQARERFPDDSAHHARAREILTAMAEHCRTAATVFDIDPTLATEPYDTGRFRAIDLLREMARQVKPLLVHACDPRGMERMRPQQERWAEVEALFERAGEIARAIVDMVPRRDYATKEGSRAISRERLTVRACDLANAAAVIRAVCGGAQVGVAHVDPTVGYLTKLAGDLERVAAALTAEREQDHPGAAVHPSLTE